MLGANQAFSLTGDYEMVILLCQKLRTDDNKLPDTVLVLQRQSEV